MGDRREAKEKEKGKVDYYFLFFFRTPQKCHAPIFLLHPQKKEKPFFRQLMGKKLPRFKKNNLG